jgi:hypothetical protein
MQRYDTGDDGSHRKGELARQQGGATVSGRLCSAGLWQSVPAGSFGRSGVAVGTIWSGRRSFRPVLALASAQMVGRGCRMAQALSCAVRMAAHGDAEGAITAEHLLQRAAAPIPSAVAAELPEIVALRRSPSCAPQASAHAVGATAGPQPTPPPAGLPRERRR